MADRFEIRAVCEPVGLRARHVADEFRAATVSGFQALARREDIDAVLVLSPGWFGALPILAACDSGKAVYCAAGLDLSPDEAKRIRRRVEETGVAFMAEFLRRHAPATLRLKELIATRLGPPQLVFCHQRLGADCADSSTEAAPSRDPIGRALVELVDWCCYVVGREPTGVTGLVHQRNGQNPEEDYRMLSLMFADGDPPAAGAVAQISCGRYIPARWREAVTYRPLAALQVSCANGIAFVDLPSTLVWFDEAGRHQESLDSELPLGERLLTQFHRAVTSLVRKKCDLEDAYRAVTIVQEARRSFFEGRRVAL
jgi:predicted dehydrogenase